MLLHAVSIIPSHVSPMEEANECSTSGACFCCHKFSIRYFSILLVIFFVFSPLQVVAVKHNYKDALHKSLLYFEAQRSGHLPYNQRVTWRDHSGLTDGLQQGVDLVGGYYDAGDHVKFGLPMAFTVTMLSWSAIEFGDEIRAAGEYDHVLEAIKWGTDYFVKAHTEPNVFWAQVGDGDSDHYCWQRPEDMTTPRQAYKIDAEHPGSDVAGETAAAMAAASMVFNSSNPQYSQLLLQHAQQLFEFGDKYRGKYDGSIAVAKRYYPSWSGYYDELLWASLWLYKATGDEAYLDYLVENGQDFGGTGWAVTEFSWDVKYAGLQILASKLLLDPKLTEKQKQMLTKFRSKAEHYVCACLNKNNGTNLNRTPSGLLFVREWNNLQYVSTASYLLTIYSDYLANPENDHNLHCPDDPDDVPVDPTVLFALAKSQVHYMLGSNPKRTSYLVGYGKRFPMNVHHRGGSIMSYKKNKGFIGCMQGYYNWYGRRGSNPNIVVGALVGGPDSLDNFRDKRGNYMQTEACTYNTAPLVGVFARLNHLAEKRIEEKAILQTSSASL